ncbi:hypothetical protein DFH94DRAFT_114519 [Russula ochroleuca]|uniref:Uncharacterized protein n=1 Tax=Russula ochroleuca TaxID=152965 RepID=A0A9P5MQP2_9AGAM|nr:hypothetical protein DFH94DRAFT_114519 [Russula ochroleuca]
MASSPLEKRTTMISAGRLPSSRLHEMSSSRPFVHQVDVVFPFDHELQVAFSELETDYYTSRAPLAEIYESLRIYGQQSGLASDAQVASTGTFLPDAWSCREGSIILNAGKETFESLGLPGHKILAQMPGAPEQHLINVSLDTPSVNVRSNDFILDSITRWDRSREGSGEGQWDFAFHISHPEKGTGPLSLSRTRHHKVKPSIRNLQNVHIPTSALPPRPNPRPTSTRRGGHRDLSHGEKTTGTDDNDALEDWNERACELFEWIGMVNIDAQRTFLSSQMATRPTVPLIGLTIHGSTGVPVLTPPRVPRLEGEDTVSIILALEGTNDPMTNRSANSGDETDLNGSWVVLESIGKWDSRFG